MTPRQLGAVLLIVLTACSGTRPLSHAPENERDRVPGAAWYGLSVVSPRTVPVEPVEVDEDAFAHTLTRLVREARPGARPHEAARRLFAQSLDGNPSESASDGYLIRLAPVQVAGSASASEAELTREYLRWCERTQGGGDCLRLLTDGPTVRGEDRYALALALSFGSVLEEARHALKGMVEAPALVAMLVWTASVYLLLWSLPDPASKALAAGLTVALLGWLGVDTVWSLMRGWVRLTEDAHRATSFAQLSAAGERFGRVMGENTARVLVMLVAAVLGGTVKTLAQKLPRLPGFQQAAVQAEAQGGVRLAAVAEVETVAASSEGTFSVVMQRPGSPASAAPAGARAAATVIRHQGGNRQVLIDGQRWHVPASKSLKDIPKSDPVGDQLQAAALRAAQRWISRGPKPQEEEAIRQAAARGDYWLARLLERQARGRFVEKQLKDEFTGLRWNPKGVDAIDLVTGYRYEILAGTESNLALHGQRMATSLFRMITF